MQIPKGTTHFIQQGNTTFFLHKEGKRYLQYVDKYGWVGCNLAPHLTIRMSPISDLKVRLTDTEEPQYYYSPDRGLTFLPCEILFESNQALVLRNTDTQDEEMFGSRDAAYLTTEPPSEHEIVLRQVLASISQHDDGTWVIPTECSAVVQRALDVCAL